MAATSTAIADAREESPAGSARSPAGPASGDALTFPEPPMVRAPRVLQTLRASVRQADFMLRARRELGETFLINTMLDRPRAAVVSHPDHVRSLFTADPAIAPSVTPTSQLVPIVGPNSVLTSIGPRHMRQRKLLLPAFHGEAVNRYREMITAAADREIDTWPVGKPFALVPRMQAITLDVIMAGIFGIEGAPTPGTPEHKLRGAVRRVLDMSTDPLAKFSELLNTGRTEPVGILRAVIGYLDRRVYAVIAARREVSGGQGRDILSLLLEAETEDGERLSDKELRDELLTLVFAGHETTANSLAWAVERLVRTPHAYDRLRDTVRSGIDPDGYLDATIHETMRARPVVPVTGRNVLVPWQLGDYVVPAGSDVLVSILLLHHRADVYPDPFAFRPERFLGVKPGTYSWIPFGGGIRRCLGAALAMAEQRVVLEAIARRTDLEADDPTPERARNRNVTMIPARGARVIVRSRCQALR